MGRPFEVVEAVVRRLPSLWLTSFRPSRLGRLKAFGEDVDAVAFAVYLDRTVALFVVRGLVAPLVSLKRPREETIAFSYGFQISTVWALVLVCWVDHF